MNACLGFCVIAALVIIHTSNVFSYHPDFSWKDVNTMMSPDLRSRMRRSSSPTVRKYCGDCSKETENSYRICGNNGILYPNECLFECSRQRIPGLEEAEDYAKCGTMSFTEFKLQRIQSHY